MAQDNHIFMEILDRPAFIVRDGIITECNQLAKNRQVRAGEEITDILPNDDPAYWEYQGGILYLRLQIGWVFCGATVIRQDDADIFLMDRDADKLQLQALALAGQQLRVPLSNVMVLSDLLLSKIVEPELKEKHGRMRKELFQLMRLISNMADAERYTGLDDPRFEQTELCTFFKEIVDKVDATLILTGIRVAYSCPESPLFTVIDRDRIERATYNLLSNAVKFSPCGSTVSVKLSRRNKRACLTVEDQGDGIASHVQGTLFYRYMREPAIEDSRFGLGLGMTLVRSAALAHDGTVLLEQSEGTKVAMTMAIRKEPPGPLRTPIMRIGDYSGGWDLGLLEFSDILPESQYEISD